ncbi:MAG: hypothetical protein ABSD58_02425 [Verrucomicrobiia bacterium]
MKKADIIAAITTRIGSSKFSVWRIGLTHDLVERKKYWADTEKLDTQYWTWWQADSLSDAQDIEAAFINKGMDGGTGGDLSLYKAVFVYIF